ncbi:hypothetical protein [Actinophytocola oryzae]|uniref:Phage gp6-like head-tail connector protein n=1 Tax=Actinophytocola oryzae TaxID=502181 RepID=A0A4R7W3J2_9PSEU|nr:hypothetical protein [Actinophytocola oryzae]TDV56628.1 hypothetical protein CLV71_102695 [Actinophytocola oryzae]
MAALATADDLTAYLGHPPTNPAQAGFVLDAASEFVRGYCGWSITRETDVVWTLDAAGGRLLAMPTLHLVSVSSVLVHGIERVGEVETSVAGLLYRHAGWPTSCRSLEVRAVYGHEQTPRDVLAVVCALASRMLTTPGTGLVTSHRISGVQVTYGSDGAETAGLTQIEQSALNRHRLVGVAPAR